MALNPTVKQYRWIGNIRCWDADPDINKRFPFNWTQWLKGEGAGVTIASVSFIPTANLSVLQQGHDTVTASALVKFIDNTLPDMQTLTCRITTNETPPQIQDCSIYINPMPE